MKNILMILVVIFSISAMSQSSTYETCFADCPDSTFAIATTGFTITCSGTFTIFVEAEYSYRKSCFGWQDVQIHAFSYRPANQSCKTDEEIYSAVLAHILQERADAGWEPENIPNECSFSFRVSARQCWAEYTWQGGGLLDEDYTVLYECEGSECCITPMKVCNDSTGKIDTIEMLMSVGSTCDSIVYGNPPHNPLGQAPPPPNTPCEIPVCDWLDDIDVQALKRSYFDVPTFNKVGLGINTDFKNNLLTISLKSHEVANIEIIISDIRGKIVTQTTFQASNNMQRIFDLGNERSGVYVYTVLGDGKLYHTGKLLIE